MQEVLLASPSVVIIRLLMYMVYLKHHVGTETESWLYCACFTWLKQSKGA